MDDGDYNYLPNPQLNGFHDSCLHGHIHILGVSIIIFVLLNNHIHGFEQHSAMYIFIFIFLILRFITENKSTKPF